jgi:hypothetical protein
MILDQFGDAIKKATQVAKSSAAKAVVEVKIIAIQ